MIDKPSEHEEEYFVRKEFERIKEVEEKRRRELEENEKERMKDLHYMHCPKCGMQLVEIDYRGIKIDRCSACDGVWLDAGELEAVSRFETTVKDKFFSIFK